MNSVVNTMYSAMNDAQLAFAAQSDDLDAFEELVRRHQHPLLCFLQFYCADTNDVDDVAQMAFLKCFQSIRQFDTSRKFKPWLYTIARRSIRRVRRLGPVSIPHPECIVAYDSDPEASAIRIESRESLWSVVRSLTRDDEFQMIWLRYADCMTIQEIADFLGDTETACKMRLSRLRKRLKPHLASFVHDFPVVESTVPSRNRAA